LQKGARKVTKYSPDVYMATAQNQTHVSFYGRELTPYNRLKALERMLKKLTFVKKTRQLMAPD